MSITSLIIVDHKNEEITCSFELDNIVGISENVPATSEDFRRFSEDFRMLPKTSEDVPANFDYFRNHLKHDNLSVFSFRLDTIFQCLIGTFSWKRNWIQNYDKILKSDWLSTALISANARA